MSELSDYQKQVAKMQQWNRLVMLSVAGFIALLFFILLGISIWQGQKRTEQTAEIVAYIQRQRERASTEAAISREGGDIIRCILYIPPSNRTQEQINACYPGGSNEAWMQHRKEVLGD